MRLLKLGYHQKRSNSMRTPLSSRRHIYQFGAPSLLSGLAMVVAVLIAVPIFAVLWNLLTPGQGTLQHLAATVLP